MKTGCTKGDACDCPDMRECGNVYPVEHDAEMYRLIGPDGEMIDAVPASWEPDHSTANAAAVYVNLSDDSLGGVHMNYDEVRQPGHATAGDAIVRFKRDSDAFTAGAQYALDHLLCRADDTFRPVVREGLDVIAASILASIHDGKLA